MSWFKDKITHTLSEHRQAEVPLSPQEKQDRAAATVKIDIELDDGWERVVLDPSKVKEDDGSSNSNTDVPGR